MEEFLNSVTVNVFKDKYDTAFQYLPVWQLDVKYKAGKRVYYLQTEDFYEAILENENIPPSNTTNWRMVQDNIALYVSDEMILKALDEAKEQLKEHSCFATLSNFKKKQVLLLLTAHFIFEKLSGNLNNGTGGLISTSRTVGNVSESFAIPEWIKNSGTYSTYSSTPYGIKYVSFLRTNCLAIERFDTNRKC